MSFKASDISQLLGGTIVGDADVEVSDFAKIEEGRQGCISFLYDPKFEQYLYTTESSIVLVNEDFEPKQNVAATLIRVKDPREAVARLLQAYQSMKPQPKGISPQAYVDETATVGEGTYIAPFVFVGSGVSIGSNCRIYSNVTIYEGCRIGNNCILHAGCVIGADGFGFQPNGRGYEKIPQIGIVILEDDVEVGANSCIDRAMMGATIIRKGVKIDNLVQIGHNCEIGENTVMSAQVGIAGSTKVGEWCMFGGQVGIAGHCTIADRTQAGAKTGIPNNVKKPGQQLMGYPALPPRQWWKAQAVIKQLPEIYKRFMVIRGAHQATQS